MAFDCQEIKALLTYLLTYLRTYSYLSSISCWQWVVTSRLHVVLNHSMSVVSPMD